MIDETQNQEHNAKKSSKKKLNKNHILGFFLGVLITAILLSAGLFIFLSFDSESSNLKGSYQPVKYDIIQDFDKEVLKAPGQTLVYFNDSSLSNNRLTNIYEYIYEYNKVATKTYNYSKNDYSYISSVGVSLNDLPCFALFENGKLIDTHSIEIMVTSVTKWLTPFTQPKIYRAFPSSAFDGVGQNYEYGYYVSEIILMPDKQSIMNFIRLSGNMTYPIKNNSALYSLLSNNFGGDNKTTFGLPNLDDQIPVSGLRYYIAGSGVYPSRDYTRDSFVDGNIKYLEFSINDINDNSFVGQVILARNVDEEKYKNIMIPCDGREFTMSQYPVLASIIENRFGGDGVTKFRLPDLTNAPTPVKGAKYYIMLRSIYPSS